MRRFSGNGGVRAARRGAVPLWTRKMQSNGLSVFARHASRVQRVGAARVQSTHPIAPNPTRSWWKYPSPRLFGPTMCQPPGVRHCALLSQQGDCRRNIPSRQNSPAHRMNSNTYRSLAASGRHTARRLPRFGGALKRKKVEHRIFRATRHRTSGRRARCGQCYRRHRARFCYLFNGYIRGAGSARWVWSSLPLCGRCHSASRVTPSLAALRICGRCPELSRNHRFDIIVRLRIEQRARQLAQLDGR